MMSLKNSQASINASKKRKAESNPASGILKKPKAKPAFPGKISKILTIAQLEEEACARGLDLGNVKHDKSFWLGVLGDGSVSVIAMARKQQKNSTTSSTKKAMGSKNEEPECEKKATANNTGKNTVKTASVKPSKKTEAKSAPNGSSKMKSATTDAKRAAKATGEQSKDTVVAATQPSIKQFLSPAKPKAASLKTVPLAASASAAIAVEPAAIISSAAVVSSAVVVSSAATANTTFTARKSATTISASSAAVSVKVTTNASGVQYPRISDKLTLAQLREEAVARQLDPKTVPKKKTDLLHHLVDGSIHVRETVTYKEYMNLLAKVASEKSRLYEESWKKKQEKDARKAELQQKRYEKEEKARQEKERERQKARDEEKERQRHLHTHSFTQVHCHSLAETKTLLMHGCPRRGTCDNCNNQRAPNGALLLSFDPPKAAVYTCEECDWDICQQCFVKENKSDAEKKRDKQKALEEWRKEERRREEEERRREEEERIRWDADLRFTAKTMKPSVKNKAVSSTLKYTVWCSDGFDNDGWHSYEGEPTKEFDTSWSTKKEANERAEYLFFWKNPWGLDPKELSDDYDGAPSPEERDGLNQWTVAPPDSSRWTVGVVPSAAYPHLEHSSERRHNQDMKRNWY